MDQQLLYKMFKGETTKEELAHIRQWTEACAENREEFFRERALFDAIQLNGLKEQSNSKKHLLYYLSGISAAAAVIALLVCLNFYFSDSGNDRQKNMAFNTVIVPSGQRTEVILADGTHIWLNSKSELSYPVSFDEEIRKVYLKGEAFFDVARDETKKFVVSAGQCDVEVLGTQFNVEAYDEKDLSVALIKGSVKVADSSDAEESVILKPNDVARFSDGKFEISAIADDNLYSWKDGLIVFKNSPFHDLMKKLEKNFGVEIRIENKHLDSYACSGKLRISDGLVVILRTLQQDAHFSWKRIDETTVVIK